MTNLLPAIPNDHEINTLQVISRTAAASGLYSGVGSEQKILMILLAARELGIGPMTALNGGIWNIQGKIELSARLMSSMIRKAGHSLTIKSISDTECTLIGKRSDNGDTFSSSFTIEEAQKAGLLRQGGNWTKYPQDMLYARALSRLARRLFADIIGNAYVEGEIRDAKFEIIESTKAEEPKEEETPEQAEQRLSDFINLCPAEDHDMVRQYVQKYATYWKKTISQSIQDFQKDKDKFYNDFIKWKGKNSPKAVA
jgi:hypothetical protein